MSPEHNQLKKWRQLLTITAIACLAFVTSCSDDETPKTLPVVVTTAVSDVTTTSGVFNGVIVDDGHATITESGFVYSSVVNEPTTSEEKLVVAANDNGLLRMEIENLTSGTTYYVRAFATNSKGTGYGAAEQFMTGNAAPTALDVTVTGTLGVGSRLTGSYTYSDNESDAEGATTLQWYVADNAAGLNEAPIAGANEDTYIIQEDQFEKFLRFGVTTRALTGTTLGAEVKSAFTAGIGEQTEVIFTYNGQEVTYGIINSTTTGRKWLDRNMGAAHAASAFNDWENYGDFFQWGRGADGHQLVTRTGPAICCPENQVHGVDAIGTIESPAFSSSDNTGHSFFIWLSPTEANLPFDWRKPQNDNLWQGANGVNNPCPLGWHVPTKAEWEAENIANLSDAYTKLKLTATAYRLYEHVSSYSYPDFGFYWTSTAEAFPPGSNNGAIGGKGSYTYGLTGSVAIMVLEERAFGHACRCIKDE